MSTTVPSSTLGRRIDIPSVPNLRDIGGYSVAGGGRVRTGLPYRSVELNHLQGDGDLEAFAELGIRTVFDMRTAPERSSRTRRRARGHGAGHLRRVEGLAERSSGGTDEGALGSGASRANARRRQGRADVREGLPRDR